MRILKDNTGTTVTLSDASEDHIKTAHPELKDRLERIAETIEQPEIVRPSSKVRWQDEGLLQAI